MNDLRSVLQSVIQPVSQRRRKRNPLAGEWLFVGVGTMDSEMADNITVQLPAGVQGGDLLIAAIAHRDATVIQPPSLDWTLLGALPGDSADPVGVGGAWLAKRIAPVGPPASYTFGRIGGDRARSVIGVWRWSTGGVAVQGPITSVTQASNVTACDVPGLVTEVDGALLVGMHGAGARAGSAGWDAGDPGGVSGAVDVVTPPTAGQWIERADGGTSTNADCALTLVEAVKEFAGPTGVISYNAAVAARHSAIVAAFYPPGS